MSWKRERRKYLRNIHEKGDNLTEKEKKEKSRFREGGHQRMQVKEERVTGRLRHTTGNNDSEDREVGEKRKAREMRRSLWLGT